MVVQWKLPEKLSSFVQRAGRVARGAGRKGVAVMLAEPSAFSIDTSTGISQTDGPEEGLGSVPSVAVASQTQTPGPTAPKPRRQAKSTNGKKATRTFKPKKMKPRLPKEFAELHGRYRGLRNGTRDEVLESLVESVHIQESTEGLHAFVQTPTCRRKVQSLVFANPTTSS